MRTIQLHIRSSLPSNFHPLWDLARNVWWSWNSSAINLFRRINPQEYEASGPCPLKLLNTLPSSTWESLKEDNGFLEHLNEVYKEFLDYLETGINKVTEYKNTNTIAYFSMEFGLHESIPLYSGGLGVLSGDHLKTASDLSLPMVGVGLFYSEGYFRQSLNKEGWQLENYDTNDPFYLPMQLLVESSNKPILVDVEIARTKIYFQIWKLNVGRIPLYLMDTNVPENSPENKLITSRLYSGGQELRIQQEIILGIGGTKALQKIQINPAVFHLNEGHSAFLTLERISQFIKKGLNWQEALIAIKGTQVFTVHTPVPAGNDAFPVQMLSHYMGDLYKNYGIPDNEFYNLGRSPENHSEFSMPIFALRTSGHRNGVSQLHKKVSKKIWKPLWPNLLDNEVPINGITNGVHTRTWLCNELVELFDFYLGKGWDAKLNESLIWKRVENIPNTEIWNMHMTRKSRLLSSISKSNLDPEYLTIGFARRFASYKRGNLIFRDIERLKKLMQNKDRPIQLIISGKSHPADNLGKEIIQSVVQSIQKENLNSNILFLENYDMQIAHKLVRGIDVWLNTPIRPLEASATSGMKVAMNGGLNFSILDGWWDEAYQPDLGWSIGSREMIANEKLRDDRDSQSLYDTLEYEIIPLYYSNKVPNEWIEKMKKSISILTPRFSANRMLMDYINKSYLPAAKFHEKWSIHSSEQIEELKNHINNVQKLREQWNQIEVTRAELKPADTVSVGETVTLQVEILSPFPEEWIEVNLVLANTENNNSYIMNKDIIMPCVEKESGKKYIYVSELETTNPEIRTYTIRVCPNPSLFPEHLDLNLVAR
ncbi:alpha-glucan family phosphorylase [Fluviispira multicolorata]|nr:alpha-glucan family phosphorylase [Fluviispira multicolorata]